jgi:FkbM family methyltransferase
MSLPDEDPGQLLQIKIGAINLTVRSKDGGGTHYLQRGHTEEYHSPFYAILRKHLDPSYCIDIGANYGFTGLLMRRYFPSAHLTLVEPVPWLEKFILHNFEENHALFDRLHSAICSDSDGEPRSAFGVKEASSQDSRVIAQPGMRQIETNVVSVSALARDIPPDSAVYLKIDTQGWEEHVFAGAEDFLQRHNRWFIKTEFAPAWLESQGSDPVALLRRLVSNYRVFEAPGRQRWNCSDLDELVGSMLEPGSESSFVHYVRNLARDDKGWVDLYVRPAMKLLDGTT